MLEKFGKKVVEHLPEILTVGACTGVIAGDVLLVRGAKKETQDGKKTHYIPGAIASGIGVACIIASNRVSNAQKVTLVGVAAALAAQNKSQREQIENKFGIDELRKMDNVTPTENNFGVTYYLPQVGMSFVAPDISEELLERAEIDINKFFDSDGQVSLDDILHKLGLAKYAYRNRDDRLLACSTIWTYKWSDEPQQIMFSKTIVNKIVELRFDVKVLGE